MLGSEAIMGNKKEVILDLRASVIIYEDRKLDKKLQ